VFAQIGWPWTQGEIFPELMSLFTLRSFAYFYLSLALAAVPLIWERNLSTLLNHGAAAYGLIVAITIAAFVYIRLFDFSAQPGGLLYIGAYLIVGIPLLFVFWKYGKHL
jgi:amino acid transporter